MGQRIASSRGGRTRAEAERIEREAAILAEQKAGQSAARKPVKKQWRKGLEEIKQTLQRG